MCNIDEECLYATGHMLSGQVQEVIRRDLTNTVICRFVLNV